jgi:hypothetical protein
LYVVVEEWIMVVGLAEEEEEVEIDVPKEGNGLRVF